MLHIHVNVCDTVQLLAGFLQCNDGLLEEADEFKMCFRGLLCVRIKMCELLSNNSLFVGQLYEDKSLVLRACDLIFFTTDLQTVYHYTTIHC